ncbi:MAG: UDP-3-O-acyl-N-acetylglucosamine deacetylase [Vulcanimicrobiaceae bacterium]
MPTEIAQATLCGPCAFDGVGLHTGAGCAIEVRPAGIDAGITFVLDGHLRVPALAEYIVDTSRATVIGRDGVSVSTVEHLLSALFGMGVSNADIHVRGPEIPVLDGSGRPFVEAIECAGILEQARARPLLVITQPLVVARGEQLVIALPSERFRVRFVADFPAPIGVQFFDGEIAAQEYARQIAPARTFGYLHEVEALRARGLALGGSLENALVFTQDGPMQPLRWQNEVVRHKVLDLLGDLSLLGLWPLAEIVAIKSGHELHARAVRALRQRFLADLARGSHVRG